MSPKIFELDDDNKLFISPETLLIKECKMIIDKHPKNAEPYLAYCHLLSNYSSPLRNIPELDRKDEAIREVLENVGNFDYNDPLLELCITRLKELYSTPLFRLFEGFEEELDNLLYYLKTTPLSSEDLNQRVKMMENCGKLAASIAATKKQVEEDFKSNIKGGHQSGDIR